MKYSGVIKGVLGIDGFPDLEMSVTKEIVSYNSQTGAEVDAQRTGVLQTYVDSLNS